jgi:capsular polysaccharide biosynthesis protein
MFIKKLLLKKVLIKRKLPTNYNTKDEFLFFNEIERELPTLYSKSYKNICINADRYLWKNFSLLEESFFRRERIRKNKLSNFKFLLKSFPKKKTVIQEGLWLIDNWSQGYFHWFGDVLQKYYALKKRNIKLILPASYAKIDFIISSSKALKIEIEFIQENNILKCKNLTIVPTTFISGNFYLEPIKRLRRALIKSQINSYNHNRVYVTRKNARFRKIKNENDLIKCLQKYKFHILDFDNIKFKEERKICFNVEIFISIHGSGLTNQLLMSSKVKVVELRHIKSTQNTFFSLASALENDYYYLNCSPFQKETAVHSADLIVNIDKLDKLIRKIIE